MKVKVKIAVAVNGKGEWSSCGYQITDPRGEQRDLKEMVGMALDGLSQEDGDAIYWLTAELDVPSAQEVPAQVEVVNV